MADREKVIKGLEHHTILGIGCTGCPYNGGYCHQLPKDALELLKEQSEIVRCKDCKYWDKTTRKEGNDCISGPWEDAECNMLRDWDRWGDLGEDFRRTNGDWFCGDGERR